MREAGKRYDVTSIPTPAYPRLVSTSSIDDHSHAAPASVLAVRLPVNVRIDFWRPIKKWDTWEAAYCRTLSDGSLANYH